MNESRWERLAAATGIPFFIFTLIGVLFFDTEGISPGDSADQVRSFLSENATKLGTQAGLALIGLFFLFWWVGSVRSTIAAAEGGAERLAGTAFGGGIALAVFTVGAYGVQAQAFFADIDKLTDTTAESLPVMLLVSDALIGMTSVARAVLFAAMAVAALRYRAFPSWTGWVSAVMALGAFVGTLTVMTGEDSPLGTVWFLFFIASFFWILVMSIVMTIRAGRAPTVPAMAETAS
jgi:hypothetical protein